MLTIELSFKVTRFLEHKHYNTGFNMIGYFIKNRNNKQFENHFHYYLAIKTHKMEYLNTPVDK